MSLEIKLEDFNTTVALFKGRSGSYEYLTVHSNTLEGNTDYLRLSDYVEVQFKPRTDAEVLVEEIDNLVKSKDRIMQEALRNIAEIEDRIQELKAITYQEG